MKYIGFEFLWFDFWVGFFYDKKKYILYVCPLPCCVFKFEAVEQLRAADVCRVCKKTKEHCEEYLLIGVFNGTRR